MNDKNIDPNDEPIRYDWSHSLSAEDAKYWRQEEVHRINSTGEMNITPIPHTNEGEATNWMMGVDLVTLKRQQRAIVRRVLFFTLDLVLALGVVAAVTFLVSSVQAATGGN